MGSVMTHDGKLRTSLLYAMADVLGMTLLHDPKTGKLSGSTSRDVMFGDLPVSVDMKVVSSLLLGDQYLAIVKVMGNLSLFVASYRDGKQDVIDLHMLNQAKTDTFHGWLEKNTPADKQVALNKLAPAVVKSFVKKTKAKWERAA